MIIGGGALIVERPAERVGSAMAEITKGPGARVRVMKASGWSTWVDAQMYLSLSTNVSTIGLMTLSNFWLAMWQSLPTRPECPGSVPAPSNGRNILPEPRDSERYEHLGRTSASCR